MNSPALALTPIPPPAGLLPRPSRADRDGSHDRSPPLSICRFATKAPARGLAAGEHLLEPPHRAAHGVVFVELHCFRNGCDASVGLGRAELQSPTTSYSYSLQRGNGNSRRSARDFLKANTRCRCRCRCRADAEDRKPLGRSKKGCSFMETGF